MQKLSFGMLGVVAYKTLFSKIMLNFVVKFILCKTQVE